MGERVQEVIEVALGGKRVTSTKREWAILSFLASYTGLLVTHRQLLRGAWAPEYGDDTSYFRTYISHIRKKLEPVAHNPRYLLSE